MMKRVFAIALALMMLCAAALADAVVPSKTTTDINKTTEVIVTVQDETVEVKETFAIIVAEDKEPVAQEIAKIYTAVVEEQTAPVEYFPAEVQTVIAEKLPEIENIAELELNEFVTVDEIDYEEAYGDVEVVFELTTLYQPEQQIVVLVGFYTGEVDEEGNYVVEWVVLDAVVTEEGFVKVLFPTDALVKLQQSEAAAMAVLNTKAEAEAEIAAE